MKKIALERIKIALEVIIAIVSIVGAIWLVQKLERNYAFLDWRYKLHQTIHTYAATAKGKPLTDQNTILVLIGDSDFWGNDYAGRLPISRERLAKLIIAISKLKPRVIAVDFNFCSPTMDGTLPENSGYEDETSKFVAAVRSISTPDCTVVLPKFLHIISTADRRYYTALPNRFDTIDPKLDKVAKFGHINLTKDFRIIPPAEALKDGTPVESFSRAIVQAFRPGHTDEGVDDTGIEYCGAYLDPGKFIIHSADEIAHAEEQNQLAELTAVFAGKIVIVGAGWTQYAAADPGDKYTPVNKVDSQYGPAGNMPAVFMHANWVESMLAERTGRPFSERLRSAIEFLIGLMAFLLFRNWVPLIHKKKTLMLTIQIVFFPAVVVFWVLISYLGFQNFGLFIDPLPGFVGAVLAIIDRMATQVWEWRQKAQAVR